MQDFGVIESHDALKAMCARLQGARRLAIDTEFMRERTYRARLCLVQLATEDVIGCIDPLAVDDLSPLAPLLKDESILKVFHAPGEDLQVLFDTFQHVVSPFFDTQVAAACAGFGDQIGYGELVKRVSGVSLNKAYTRTDWTRRPLSPQQVAYARDDVHYLLPIHAQLTETLEQMGRLQWVADELSQWSDPARFAPDVRQAWRRVKGTGRLDETSFRAMVRLACWREKRARRVDRPRGWILKDEVLVTLARLRPDSAEGLTLVRGLPESTLKKVGDELMAVLADDASTPAYERPQRKRGGRQGADAHAMVDMMMAWVRTCAQGESVPPNLLASRKSLDRLVSGDRDVRVLKGWRKRVVGDDLLALLEGQAMLRVQKGRVTLHRD